MIAAKLFMSLQKQMLLLKWKIIAFCWFCAGAIKLHTPLLMPRNKKLYEHNEASYLMDHSGMLVMLPYDLRVSNIFLAGSAGVEEYCLSIHLAHWVWFRCTLSLTAEAVHLSASVVFFLILPSWFWQLQPWQFREEVHYFLFSFF